jgi:hypothetical protein
MALLTDSFHLSHEPARVIIEMGQFPYKNDCRISGNTIPTAPILPTPPTAPKQKLFHHIVSLFQFQCIK